MFGLELTESIEKVSVKIPSESFKDFLLGLRTIIKTGGDLRRYLEEKADTSIDDYKRRIEEYGKSLSILLEIYITVVVVGSIFALILSTVLGLFAGGEMNIQAIQLLLILHFQLLEVQPQMGNNIFILKIIQVHQEVIIHL